MLTWVSAGIAVWVGKGQRVCTPLYLCLLYQLMHGVEHHLLQHLVHAALYILCASSPVVCLSLPSLNNGWISYTDSTLGLNTVATHSCEPGYKLTGGTSMRTCTVSGWDGTALTCTGESVELALSAAI